MRRYLTLCVALLAWPCLVLAQGRSPGPVPTNAGSAGVAFIRFAPDDRDVPSWFEVKAVAPTVAINLAGLSISFIRAVDTSPVDGVRSELELLDLTLLLYNDLDLFGRTGRRLVEPLVPIAITTTWRRVDQTQGAVTSSQFEYQTLGVGTGIGGRALRSAWMAEARITPSAALATQSFGRSFGTVLGVDAGIHVTTRRLLGPLGLHVGYDFAWKRWNVPAAGAGSISGSDRRRLTGHEHVVRIGLSW